MKLAIIADTHMPRKARSLPESLMQGLQNVDYILHAGDWQTIEVAEMLAQFAPIDGVAGNVDGEEIVSRFGYRKVLHFGSIAIGLVHGHGQGGTTEKRARAAFMEEKVDILIFGHSHIPMQRLEADGTLLFNPGSPTDKRRQPRYSYGILTLDGGAFQARHVYFGR